MDAYIILFRDRGTMERIDFSTQSAHCQAVGKRICELANSSDGLTLQIYL